MTGVGSITSHHGIERNRESAASRLTRWVVPDRGRPDHDDRRLELDLERLGVAADVVLEPQSGLQQADHAVADDVPAESGQARVGIERGGHGGQADRQGWGRRNRTGRSSGSPRR